jgi:hypothetical protein
LSVSVTPRAALHILAALGYHWKKGSRGVRDSTELFERLGAFAAKTVGAGRRDRMKNAA